jgi:hypothetical protein
VRVNLDDRLRPISARSVRGVDLVADVLGADFRERARDAEYSWIIARSRSKTFIGQAPFCENSRPRDISHAEMASPAIVDAEVSR